MNLLFIHGNYPGQFKDIAPRLAQHVRGRTFFLTLSDNPQNIALSGIHVRQFKLHRDVSSETHAYLQQAELAVLKGQAVLRSLDQLSKRENFVPDVVVCHGGMGFGLFIKSLLPNVRLISYMEWFFMKNNSYYLFDQLLINDICRLETRNLPLLQEIVQADRIVCPTHWQQQQFPEFIRSQIQIIFDGVDQDFFCPGPPPDTFSVEREGEFPLKFTSNQLLLTYGTRGMEPLRGFPEFMRAAAAAQQEFSDLQVVVFGSDRAAYSYSSPHETGSWKLHLLEQLGDQLDVNRLHFTGSLSYGELLQLFRRSDLHCYFTRPYVVSWGVFQAAASGCRLLVNDFPGINEVFNDTSIYPVVDLDDQSMINKCVISQLSSSKTPGHKRCNLKEGLDLESSLRKWRSLLDSIFLPR